MKNIADVNSDDILNELNNIGYEEEDLKLLDDEDIKPINNEIDDDLSEFYLDYDNKDSKVDLYTEKPKKDVSGPFDKYVEKVPEKKEEVKVVKEDSSRSVDAYLNRSTPITGNEPVKDKTYQTPSLVTKTYQPPVPKTQPAVKPSNNQANLNDINQLFNKVSNNVKGASELVNRNAELKRKIDERMAELKRLQQEHEAIKQKDIQEINAYRDEVYNKIQTKKVDIEKDVKELRAEQDKLEREKREFEAYKQSTLANLNKLEKELKESYESRNKNIEQVELGLVKRKEQLDKEREAIAKEKEELANNLVKFNKLVSDFTQDMDNFQ